MEAESNDAIWGVAAIAKEINRNERQTYYLLQNKKLPAKKVGAIWQSSRWKLRAFFAKGDAA